MGEIWDVTISQPGQPNNIIQECQRPSDRFRYRQRADSIPNPQNPCGHRAAINSLKRGPLGIPCSASRRSVLGNPGRKNISAIANGSDDGRVARIVVQLFAQAADTDIDAAIDMAYALREMEHETLQTAKGRAADRSFHSILLAASQNAFLATLASSVSAAVDLSTFFKQRTQRLRRDAVPDHWRVYRAIAASDPKAARRAMRQLVKFAFADTTAAALNGESVKLSAP